MKKILLPLVALCFGFYATDSSAQIFRLTVSETGNQVIDTFVKGKIQEIENEINKDLPGAQPKRLMEGMANSSVMAGKGIGSDYASNMEVFLIGAGLGVGADLEKDKNTDSDISGLGVAPGVVIGTNLGWMDTARLLGMDTNRLNVYLNFMSYGHDQDFGENGSKTGAEIDMTSFGVHFRYNWIKGNGSKLLGWGGVKLHFGYEYNKTDLTFNTSINEEVNPDPGPNGEVFNNTTITGSPRATILVNTHSIPLEVSTDVQLLYILSLYGGLGADLNFGEAKGDGALNSPAQTITCTGGACGNGAGTDITVKPEANIDATGKVNPLTFRGFAGLQINLPYVRIFGQVDKSLGDDLIGATAGVRFVY